jgi:ethanolamine transporter EutH
MEEKRMKKLAKRAQMKLVDLAVKTKVILGDNRGEGFVDSAVKILISVVIGALLLAGLYALFGDIILPTLEERIQDMFDFAG